MIKIVLDMKRKGVEGRPDDYEIQRRMLPSIKRKNDLIMSK